MKPDPQRTSAWITLPAEATEAMIEAYFAECDRHGFMAFINATTAYRAMVAARPPAPVFGGWQPISTAYRDGRPILASSVNHDACGVVCWQDGAPSGSQILGGDLAEEGWVNNGRIKDRFYANPHWFTHWKPLDAGAADELIAARPPLTDAQVEAMCRAHDAEESSEMGEPSLWVVHDRGDFVGTAEQWTTYREERLACMRAAIKALENP